MHIEIFILWHHTAVCVLSLEDKFKKLQFWPSDLVWDHGASTQGVI